jgi:DNA-binding CsgD family transcriptional regulator
VRLWLVLVQNRRVGGGLLERHDELEQVRDLLAAAASGSGSALAIVGPSGIGKTALLRAAIRDAPDRGFQVGTATGGELERDHPFGVCRDLFRPLVLAVSADERAELFSGAAVVCRGAVGFSAAHPTAAVDLGAVLHAVYWLIVGLAERAPLLLVVDDLHWVDAPSLRLLAYLTRRLAGLPVAMLLGSRPPAPGPDGELCAAVLADPGLRMLELAPLTASAVTSLVRDHFGSDVAPDFCSACVRAAGGNPFLTVELLRALRAEGVSPTSGSAAMVAQVGGARASRTIMRRLRGLSAEARAVAGALAVLHGTGNLGHVAGLAELSRTETIAAVDELAHADLVTAGAQITFTHPLVASAVYGSVPVGSRAQAHSRAARLEHQTSNDLDRAAAHLLAAPPLGDPWAAQVLLDAGRLAQQQAAPQTAQRFLSRALAEPPPAELRFATLMALGVAERMLGQPAAVDHLTEALTRADDGTAEVEAAIALRAAYVSLGRGIDAVAALRDVHTRVTDPGLRLRLEASIAHTGMSYASAVTLAQPEIDSINRRVTAGEPLPPEVDAIATLVAAATNTGSAAEIARRAARVFEEVRATHPPATLPIWCGTASWPLVVAEHPEADQLNSWLATEARRRGDSLLLFIALQNLAWNRFRHGDLAGATAADARSALGISQLGAGPVNMPEASVALVMHLHLAAGDVAEAAATLAEHGLDGDLDAELWTYALLLQARAALRLAQNDVPAAIADLRAVGTWCLATRNVSPSALSWRSDLATALHRLGQDTEAAELATIELDLATAFGAPRAIGIAARTLATITGDADLMNRSCVTLEHAGATLELARALLEHGGLLRHTRARADARLPLARALDLATRCGARPLADLAHTELRLTGAQVRRTALTGRDALTAAELRTASLAAGGHTNKQIAQTTFVTIKTVETQLAAAYRKLGITNRTQLPTALAT